MRVVSLNLDHGDATVVGRALRLALDRCRCADDARHAHCDDCKALIATLAELERLIQRPASGNAPLLTLVGTDGRRQPEPLPGGDRRLRGEPCFRLLAGDGGLLGNR